MNQLRSRRYRHLAFLAGNPSAVPLPSQGNKVLAFNGDAGISVQHIRVSDIDRAIVSSGEKIRGALARKCRQVAPRMLHLAEFGDVVVLYDMPDRKYLAYLNELYGLLPIIVAPDHVDDSDTLDLIKDVMRSGRAMRTLRKFARKNRNALVDPFTADYKVCQLAEKLGLDVAGIPQEEIIKNLVVKLNFKYDFQLICIELGIPLPNSRYAEGWDDLIVQTTRTLEEFGSAVLRRTLAAGGLGVIMLDQQVVKDFDGTLEEYLESKIEDKAAWSGEIILVEEKLPLVASPSTLVFVNDDGSFDIRVVSDQLMDGGDFLGSVFPSEQDSALIDRMIEYTRLYAEWFVAQGGRGWFNIDWGVLADGSLVAFESNARYTGSVHPLIIAERLLGTDVTPYIWSNDNYRVPVGMSTSTALKIMGDLLWDEERRSGVILSIPPAGDKKKYTMGIVIVAETREERERLRAELEARIEKAKELSLSSRLRLVLSVGALYLTVRAFQRVLG